MILDIKKIKSDFPILKKKINNKKLIYLDNAATTQKPKIVINTNKIVYKNYYSSVHRSTHNLSNITTNKIEEVRIKVSKFINADSPEEIIFVKGTTEAINLLVNTFALNNLTSKNNIIISMMEHHSNIIPWFLLSKKIGFIIKIIKITQNGELDLNNFYSLIDKYTKIISVVHISNVLGTINPINKIINIANKKKIFTIIDGSQAISHKNINVKKLKCNFYLFSGHKMYAPTGIGILYNKKNILNNYIPFETGGGIVSNINIKNNNIKNINFINSP